MIMKEAGITVISTEKKEKRRKEDADADTDTDHLF